MKYHIWKPLNDIEGPCFLDRFTDDWEDVRLLFGEVEFNGFFRLRFTTIIASRFTDRRGNVHLHEGGVRDDWSFYRVSNSDFEAWLHEANGGILEDSGRGDLIHYAICTTYECIDILSYNPPECEWLREWLRE